VKLCTMSWIGVAPALFTATSKASRITSGRFRSSRSQPWYSHRRCRPSDFIVPTVAGTYGAIPPNASTLAGAMPADTLLDALLAATPPAATTVPAWLAATAHARTSPRTIDRALLGGAHADRLGFAFAAGYSEALRFLVPSLDGITALCATEAEGNQPRAIKTRLTPTAHGFTLTGSKKWATVASQASSLLVVASVGEHDGRNQLKVVRVPASAPGVTLRSSAAPFIPEIEHAEVDLHDVPIPADAVLPGDGYTDYLKPFRTVEDLHVHAALVGYLLTVSRRVSPALVEPLLALAASTRSLADADVKAPSTHLALAGLIELATRTVADVERAWSTHPDDEWTRWQRDRPLLQVATKARLARRDKARASLR
jgi:acyl-CoA dehydrogenase